MLKLCIFTVMLPDLTPEEAVQALAETGYDGVEWRVTTTPAEKRAERPSFWGNNLCTFAPTAEEAHQARDLAEKAGLKIPGLGTYIAVGDLEATEQAMQFAQICGAPQIRVGAGSLQEGRTYAESFEAARAFLKEVEPLARRCGIKALVEIHHGTIICSASLAHRLVEGFDPEYIGVIHDAGNMVHEGYEDYRIGIQLLGPYLTHVHVKNAAYQRPENGGVWRAQWSPLDDGVVDFDRLFTNLRDAGYNGWIGLEDFSGYYPTRETLQRDITFLRDVIARTYGD